MHSSAGRRNGASAPHAQAVPAIDSQSVDTMCREMYRLPNADCTAHAISGRPHSIRMFFPGTPFEPPRAKVQLRIRVTDPPPCPAISITTSAETSCFPQILTHLPLIFHPPDIGQVQRFPNRQIPPKTQLFPPLRPAHKKSHRQTRNPFGFSLQSDGFLISEYSVLPLRRHTPHTILHHATDLQTRSPQPPVTS